MQHRSLDKYARLMQKLEIVNVELFKVLLLPLDVIDLQLDIFCLVICFHVLFSSLFLKKDFLNRDFANCLGSSFTSSLRPSVSKIFILVERL